MSMKHIRVISTLVVTVFALQLLADVPQEPTIQSNKKNKITQTKKTKQNIEAVDAQPTDVKIASESQEQAAVKHAISGLPQDAYLLDAIEAVVHAPEGSKVITRAEVERPSLDGRPRTLEDLIYESLMLLDAKKFKMEPDEEMIDKHLASVQRENNITLEDLKKLFKSSGYSFEEGREQFGIISIVNNILDFKIRSRVVVPEKDVLAYYNANPENHDAASLIQHAVVSFSREQSKQEQQDEIQRFVRNNEGIVYIRWEEPFWIEHSELAEDKKFITRLGQGAISDPHEAADGFELFRVQEIRDAKLKTMEERYRSIVDVLRKPKYDQMLNDYRKELMSQASVVYFN